MSDDWDVDSYKSEFENEEHWQLRRNFMLAHKDKFPEDELVCLAQAFTNVEFMGCRYPDETMVRIAELAKGVVEKFREQRKNCLKRTFVAASEAASAKAKGQVPKPIESPPPNKIRKIEKIEKDSESTKEEIVGERISTAVDISNLSEDKSLLMGLDKESELWSLSDLYEKNDSVNLTKEEKAKVRLKNFTLLLSSENDNPVSVMQKSISFNRCNSRWKFEQTSSSLFTCQLFINDQLIATGNGRSTKVSKEQTAMAAVAKFRESHFAIKVKCKFFSKTVITPADFGPDFKPTSSGSDSKQSSSDMGEDNIGRKIMLQMGWKGGGLGSHEQGIKSPIISTGQHTKKGFGNHEEYEKNPETANVKNTENSFGKCKQDQKNPANTNKKNKNKGLINNEQGIKNPVNTKKKNKNKGSGNNEQGLKNPVNTNKENKNKDSGNNEQGFKNPVNTKKKNKNKGSDNNEQGIKNPVGVTVKKKKGSGPGVPENMAFFIKAKKFIKNWMLTNSDEEDLIFSTDFTSEERKMMHRAAMPFSLKSKSYGKGEVRHLVLSKKLTPWDIVQKLLKNGGSTEKYELIYPIKPQV